MIIKDSFNRIFKQKIGDKGSVMVTVLVAFLFVSILVAIIMSTVTLNYQMKAIDRRTKDEFYYAEKALNDIYTGLGMDMSKIMGEAYSNTLALYKGTNGTYKDEESAYDQFVVNFVTMFKNDFDSRHEEIFNGYIVSDAVSKNGSLKTSRSKVKKYGTIEYYEYDSATKNRKKINSMLAISDPEVAKRVIAIVFKGIAVQSNPDAKDNIGYVSEINTDIVIEIPKLSFFTVNNKVFDYALIANNGIEFERGAQGLIKGNIYGGTIPFASSAYRTYSDSAQYGGIHISDNASLTVKDAKYFVCGGDINIDSNSQMQINTDNSVLNNQIWFENLEVRGHDSSVTINGDVFAADDLQVNKGSDRSRVSINGNYYGYNDGNQEIKVVNPENSLQTWTLTTKKARLVDESNAVGDAVSNIKYLLNYDGSKYNTYTPARSSSIIMNSKDAIIDLSGLKTMMLLGKTYINHTSKTGIDVDFGKIEDASLPESVALKSSQALTLVPTDFSGLQNPIVCESGNSDPYASFKENIKLKMTSNTWFGHEYVDGNEPYLYIKVKDATQVYAYYYINFKDEESKINYIKRIYEGSDEGDEPTAATLKRELLASTENYNGQILIGNETRIHSTNAILGYDGNTLLFPEDDDIATEGIFSAYSKNLYRRYRILDTYLDPMSDIPFSSNVTDSRDFGFYDFKKEDNEMPFARFFWLWGMRKASSPNPAISGTYADIMKRDIDERKKEIEEFGSNLIFVKDSSFDIDLCEVLGNESFRKAFILIDGNAYIKNDLAINGFIACTGKLTVKENVKLTVTYDAALLNKRIAQELKIVDNNGGYHDENRPDNNLKMRNLLIYYLMNSDRNLYKQSTEYQLPFIVSELNHTKMRDNQKPELDPAPLSYREYKYTGTLGTSSKKDINTDYVDFVYFENWKKGQRDF